MTTKGELVVFILVGKRLIPLTAREIDIPSVE